MVPVRGFEPRPSAPRADVLTNDTRPEFCRDQIFLFLHSLPFRLMGLGSSFGYSPSRGSGKCVAALHPGACAAEATARWCARLDSNQHPPASRAGASSSWATRALFRGDRSSRSSDARRLSRYRGWASSLRTQPPDRRGDPGRTRTCNLPVRSRVLFQLSYGTCRSVPHAANAALVSASGIEPESARF